MESAPEPAVKGPEETQAAPSAVVKDVGALDCGDPRIYNAVQMALESEFTTDPAKSSVYEWVQECHYDVANAEGFPAEQFTIYVAQHDGCSMSWPLECIGAFRTSVEPIEVVTASGVTAGSHTWDGLNGFVAGESLAYSDDLAVFVASGQHPEEMSTRRHLLSPDEHAALAGEVLANLSE